MTTEEERAQNIQKDTLTKIKMPNEDAFVDVTVDLEEKSANLLMRNPNVQTVIADVDEDGTLVIPEDAPDGLKDWVRNG